MRTQQDKKFTVADANRTLPLVSRIVRDIVEKHHRHRELSAADPGNTDADTKETMAQLKKEIAGHEEELRVVGCSVADYSMGLVDFEAVHEGEPILLCWKLGESGIGWWHSATGGFEGRRPIDELSAETLGSS